MRALLKRVSAVVIGVLVLGPATALAQAAPAQGGRDSRVQVTVVDPSGAVVPDAAVTLTGLEPSTQAALPVVKSNDKGIAIVERVPPGRYSISAEFPGFGLGLLRDIRARAGDSRHVVVLPLQGFEDRVVVARDTQEAAADRRTSEFGLKMSSEQISALSDDPAELQRQLAELAGPDAVFRIDSFEGQQLPPKAQIKSIHITRDQFAAEAANPGSTFVDIVTQPGIGPLRGGANLSFRDGSMSGKSQFTDVRGAEQTKNFGGNVGGTLVSGRTSFNASLNGQTDFTTPILNAALPDGTQSKTLSVRQPNRFVNANVVVDHALTRDQTLRVTALMQQRKRENIGIGNYNLPERGFSQEEKVWGMRLQEAGPIGRRAFINSRWGIQHIDLAMDSVTHAPTIVVQDAFTRGGAQQQQFADVIQSVLASDIDYVRGRNSFRGGLEFQGNWFTANSRFNYLGTYTFASLNDYNAARPILYTRSLGNPENRYSNLQGAFYVQDDIRVKRGLTLSPGLRYTMQTRVDDRSGFAPRFGMTWAPKPNGATTLRGSVGVFHGFLPLQMIEQSLRLNGELQREIYLSNPSYPDPGEVTALAIPTNKYVIGDFNLQRNLRYSAGLDQVLSPRARVNLLYNYVHIQQQPRGLNVNPLVDGARIDPRFANVIEAVTDTEIRRHELSVNAIVNLAPPAAGGGQRRIDWRRLTFNASYNLTRARSNSDGAWTVSPTGNIDDDWGPGQGDQPYRVQVLLTSNQIRNVTANINYSASAGGVYSLTTGRDDNGDGLVNDRPLGVGLRSLRGAGQQTLNARAQYAFQLGAPAGATGPAGPQGRYRLNLFVNIQNLTNHLNYGGYSGVMTSPFFMRPTLAANPRRIDMGMGVNF
jgi:hypothetical protein